MKSLKAKAKALSPSPLPSQRNVQRAVVGAGNGHLDLIKYLVKD
jgi:hypothetical protein